MKNIVFCADGTWNGPDRDDIPDPSDKVTNVFRLFSTLEGQDDPASLRAFAAQVDVISFEFENVSAEGLDLLA